MNSAYVLLCLLAPALLCVCWMIGQGVAHLVRGWRQRRSECRRHVRMLLPTRVGVVELCCTCDAGRVVDDRWQFADPVEADHTLG
jgi:hypothetical protein